MSKKKAGEKQLVVGISGASGAILGIELLKALKEIGIYSHLVITDGAIDTISLETEYSLKEVFSLAGCAYDLHDLKAPVSSGTFQTMGMVVIPCSMKTVAGIYSGYSDNLLLRAADVTLKESP